MAKTNQRMSRSNGTISGGAGSLASDVRAISDSQQWQETKRTRRAYDAAQDARWAPNGTVKRYPNDKLPGAAETWGRESVTDAPADPFERARLVQAALAARQG